MRIRVFRILAHWFFVIIECDSHLFVGQHYTVDPDGSQRTLVFWLLLFKWVVVSWFVLLNWSAQLRVICWAHPLFPDWPKVLVHSQLLLFYFSFRVPTSSIRCSEKYTHNTARTDLRKKMKTSQRRNSHTHTLAHLEFVHVAIIVALDGVSIQKMIFEKSFSLVFIFYPPLPSLLENLKIVDMRVFVSFFLSYSVCVYTPISILSLLYIYRAWLAAVKPFGSMSIRIFPLHVPT